MKRKRNLGNEEIDFEPLLFHYHKRTSFFFTGIGIKNYIIQSSGKNTYPITNNLMHVRHSIASNIIFINNLMNIKFYIF